MIKRILNSQIMDDIGQITLTQNMTISELFNAFSEHNINSLLVGGTVRSIVMEEPVSDIDIVVDCSFSYLQDVMTQDPLLKEGILRIRENQELISWGALDKNVIDINTLRPLVPSSPPGNFEESILEDSFTRDFTINALYYDTSTRELMDLQNSLQDIRTNTLKLIKHPLQTHNHKLALRILKFLSKKYFYKSEILSYLNAHLASDLQQLGDYITRRWIQNQIIRKGYDLNLFAETCKEFIDDPDTLGILLVAIEDVKKIDINEVEWV